MFDRFWTDAHLRGTDGPPDAPPGAIAHGAMAAMDGRIGRRGALPGAAAAVTDGRGAGTLAGREAG